nr:MAG: hypothetical protein DIU58_15945 [Sphaerobacter thermophilus]
MPVQWLQAYITHRNPVLCRVWEMVVYDRSHDIDQEHIVHVTCQSVERSTVDQDLSIDDTQYLQWTTLALFLPLGKGGDVLNVEDCTIGFRSATECASSPIRLHCPNSETHHRCAGPFHQFREGL